MASEHTTKFEERNITFNTVTAVGGIRSAAQTNNESGENGTFTATIFANNDIGIGVEFDCHIGMAHEIAQMDAQDFAAACTSASNPLNFRGSNAAYCVNITIIRTFVHLYCKQWPFCYISLSFRHRHAFALKVTVNQNPFSRNF